ncbi:hypothetical protein BD410DRAFT_789719 [Rickenella mellea]|uniref:Uncharacterized protein n=1 Tax=Rickenella mellea TaxID=50990 RepID=A0A4Y7Q2T9_9AGAM|nr:hypothetical protein BD410DRAFT_789719 [Rickenella mellea]
MIGILPCSLPVCLIYTTSSCAILFLLLEDLPQSRQNFSPSAILRRNPVEPNSSPALCPTQNSCAF